MPISVSGVKYTFGVKPRADEDRSYQYILIKTLLGAASLEYRGMRIRQKLDYSVLPPTPQTKVNSEAFSDFLSSFNIALTEREFIRETTPSNRTFFSDILIEFSHFFIQTHRQSHTAAFAHLYRILERMSFSTPLLYCKASTDYYGTFDELKALFTEIDKAGELGFLKKFLNQGKLIDPLILDFVFGIDFSGYLDKTQHWEVLQRCFSSFETKDQATHKFEIKFREMCSFTTTIRNRFFHLRTGDGQRNISVRMLGDPNDFFSEINKSVSSFIAIIVLHCVAKI